MVQTNFEDSYYFMLRYLLKAGYWIKEIDSCYFSDFLIDLENCIYQFSRLWLFKECYLFLIKEVYNQITSNHPDWQKTLSFLTYNYYLSKIKDIVYRYIQNYYIYRYAKASRDWYNSILKLLSISIYSWTDVTLEFVTGLPFSNSYNEVLIVIDQLIKKSHYISYTIDINNMITKAITYLLFNTVWKFYGLFLLLILD